MTNDHTKADNLLNIFLQAFRFEHELSTIMFHGTQLFLLLISFIINRTDTQMKHQSNQLRIKVTASCLWVALCLYKDYLAIHTFKVRCRFL